MEVLTACSRLHLTVIEFKRDFNDQLRDMKNRQLRNHLGVW